MKITSVLVIVCFVVAGLRAQDSLLVDQFKANSYPVSFNNGQLSGAGFDFMVEMGAKRPFFLIGEAHGIAEVADFTKALFKALRKQGYRYFAAETGPHLAEFLEEKASQRDFYTQLASFFRNLPL